MLAKYGVLFGTFNPIHYGHLAIANRALEQFNLTKVLFVTSFIPPHRIDKPVDAYLRNYMVQLAIKDNPQFDLLDIEIKRQGLSYTIDSVKEIIRLLDCHHKLYLIIGSDNLLSFTTWQNYQEILDLTNILIAPRNDMSFNNKDFSKWLISQKLPTILTEKIELINLPSNNISSSHIRDLCANKSSLKYLIPDNVINFINDQNLYRK